MRQSTPLRRAAAAALLAATLALAGCGDDGTAADEAPGQMSPTSGGVVEDVAPGDVTSPPVEGTTSP